MFQVCVWNASTKSEQRTTKQKAKKLMREAMAAEMLDHIWPNETLYKEDLVGEEQKPHVAGRFRGEGDPAGGSRRVVGVQEQHRAQRQV